MHSTKRISVMQLIDSLNVGGAERMAVNVANALPEDRFESHLCATRRDGLLAAEIAPHVKILSLHRHNRFDLVAILRLVRYIRENRIELLHAHSTTLFIAVAARILSDTRIVWHDHYGAHDVHQRNETLYWLPTRFVDHVIAVNQSLSQWLQSSVGYSSVKIDVMQNFVDHDDNYNELAPNLPGDQQTRLVFVANLRPQKDHFTIIRALRSVIQETPAHLLLVGAAGDAEYAEAIESLVVELGLQSNVHYLGLRSDVSSILKACAIGVISSKSEGLPLALLEYGMAGLPVVSTRVGDCATVLADGELGLLVDPENPDQLAEAIVNLLKSPERRQELGEKFQTHVMQNYSRQAVITQLTEIYDRVLRA